MSDRRDQSKENLDRRYEEDVERIRKQIDHSLYRIATTTQKIEEEGAALCELLKSA